MQTDVPFLVVAPSDDTLVSYDGQVAGVDAMCATGNTVELRTVTGGHGAMFESTSVWHDTVDWIAARFAWATASSTCDPL